MTSTVAIAGIGSKLALLIAQELLQHQDVYIRGSSRDTSKLPDFLKDSPRVKLVQSDPFDRTALGTLVEGSQVVACCYYAENETMIKGQKLLIDLCEEQGIKRFVASDYTGDYRKLDYGDIILKDAMKTVKEYLDQNTKVEGVHILVSLFMEIWDVFFDWNPEQKVLPYYGTGEEMWELTSYRTTAQYVAAVILDPSAHGVLKCKFILRPHPQCDTLETIPPPDTSKTIAYCCTCPQFLATEEQPTRLPGITKLLQASSLL
jgi:hypothetical protein